MISIIVAADEDLLIGKKDSSNGMPWNVPEDLKHFKATTVNKTIRSEERRVGKEC